MKHVYLAGPFFNETEVKNIEKAESVLEERGFDLFSPMRHEVRTEPGTVDWARDRADLVVALYYGNVSDSGTAWECGYAYAKGVPVVLVHVNEDADSNLMMHVGCATNISWGDLETFDFEQLPRFEYEGEMF